VVGGANSAGQAAMFFAQHAAKVTLVVRGPVLERRMSQYLIDQNRAQPNIEVRLCTRVETCLGEDHLELLTLVDDTTGAREDLKASHSLIFIGAQPQTDGLPADVVKDGDGFVVTGRDLVLDGQPPRGWTLDRE